MSDIVERTLASFPRLLSSALLGSGRGGRTGQSVPSQNLQSLLRAVDNSRSHSEEQTLVSKELSRIKQQFEQPGASVNQWSEAFPRIIFCSVLGYDVSFCHIYALKLTAQGKGRGKRVGYLAATLLLDPSCEITIMIMGTLQRDLHSSNILDNLMALCAAAQLVSMEHIPLMLPPVVPLLQHQQAIVRAKAVCCVHAFFQRAPSLMQQTLPRVKSMLGDKDPGVLSVVVTLIAWLAERDGAEFVSLGLDLINILQQIRERRFPRTFSYNGIPLPWLQIQLLKTLARLGSMDDDVAAALLPVLAHILKDTVPKKTISLAILDESILTIAALAGAVTRTGQGRGGEGAWGECGDGVLCSGGAAMETSLYDSVVSKNNIGGEHLQRPASRTVQPEQGHSTDDKGTRVAKFVPLLEEASKYLACFLESDEANLRYLGVKALTQLVCVNAELAVHHQRAVVQCLDDPDFIVRQQTLTLLHHMANPANVKVICSKMLEHVHGRDSSLEAGVVDMVVDIGGRLSPDPEWYLHTLLPLLDLRIDAERLRSIIDSMLQYFTRVCRDPQWPAFPTTLFSTMVEGVIHSQHKSQSALLFSLRVLRFVPLPVSEDFCGEGFLAACEELLKRDKQGEVREQLVLCVQTLMLRGCVGRLPVSQWATSLLDTCGHSSQRRCRQTLSELLRLASLHTDFSSLTVQKSMDFTLSFLDSYAKEMCRVGQPLVNTKRFKGLGEVNESVLSTHSELPSSSHGSSSGQWNEGGASGPADTSQYAGSSVDEGSSLPGPAVKQLWSKEGFAGSTPEDTQGDDAVMEQQDKEEELARALFQGLSTSLSVTAPTASTLLSMTPVSQTSPVSMTAVSQTSPVSMTPVSQTSPVSMTPVSQTSPVSMTPVSQTSPVSMTPVSQTSSVSVGSSWMSSLSPMVTSSEDTVLGSTSNLFLSSHNNSYQDTAVPSLSGLQSQDMTLPDPQSQDITPPDPQSQDITLLDPQSQHITWEEAALSSSTHVASAPGTWKMLHMAHSVAQTTESAENENRLSDLGSGSNLSISDDSLENRSLQNSPARQPLPPSSPCDGGGSLVNSDEMRESTVAQFLEAQMAEYESTLTTSESPARGESMYNGFEVLAQLTGEWEEVEGGELKNGGAGSREDDVDENDKSVGTEGIQKEEENEVVSERQNTER